MTKIPEPLRDRKFEQVAVANDAERLYPQTARSILTADSPEELRDFTWHWLNRRALRYSVFTNFIDTSNGCTAFSHQGKFVSLCGNRVGLYSIDDPASPIPIPVSERPVVTNALSPSGKYVAWADSTQIVVFDLHSQQVRANYQLPDKKAAKVLAFSTDDTVFAIGTDTGAFLSRLTDETPSLQDTGFRTDEMLVDELTLGFTRANDGTNVFLVGGRYDTNTIRFEGTDFRTTDRPLNGKLFATSPFQPLVAVAKDALIPTEMDIFRMRSDNWHLVGTLKEKAFGTPTDNEGVFQAASFSSDGRLLASAHLGGYSEGFINIWDVESATLVAQIRPTPRMSFDKSVILQFWPSDEVLLYGDGHSKGALLTDVCGTPRCVVLTDTSDDNVFEQLKEIGVVETRTEINFSNKRPNMSPEPVKRQRILSKDNRIEVLPDIDRTGESDSRRASATLLHLDNNETVKLQGNTRGIDAWAFSPDGRTLAAVNLQDLFAANRFSELILWDPLTGQQRVRQRINEKYGATSYGKVKLLQFSKDSRSLVLLVGNELLIWDANRDVGEWNRIENMKAPNLPAASQ